MRLCRLPIADWFAGKGWAPRRHQLEMLAAARAGRSALLVAPTGAGKTLAGFLPSLAELIERADRRPAHALHLAAEGAGGRRAAQPADPDRGDGAADPGRDPHRRHALRPQGAAAGAAAADPADHARIAEPAAQPRGQPHPVRRPFAPSSSTRSTPSPPASAATCWPCRWPGCRRSRRGCAGSAFPPRSPIPKPIRAGSRRMAMSRRSTSCSAIPAPRPRSRSCCPRTRRSPGPAIAAAGRRRT